jgi:hypothetical protein
MSMNLLRRSRPVRWDEEHHRLVRGALGRLDPWTYRVAMLGPDAGAEYAVVGATGGFVVGICGLEGYVEPSRGGLAIDGRPVDGLRAVAKAAKRAEGKLLEAHVFSSVAPILCLTKAMAGASRTVGRVRVVRLADLAAEIAGGPRQRIDPTSARKGAEALGTVVENASGARPLEDT